MRTVALAAFASVLGVTSVLAPREVAAEPGETFVATLVGDEETPPNTSGALAKGSAGLNPDDTFSYSIKSTRFDTDFRVAHLHLFGGISVAEAGAALGLSRAVAYRNWKYARAWLRDALEK